MASDSGRLVLKHGIPARFSALATTLLAAAILSACAPGGARLNGHLDVAEAKRATQSVEVQIVEAIPLDLLESVVQKQRGVFLSCGDGGHQWAGSLEVDIQGDPEPEEVLTPVRDFFHNRSGFGAATRSDESGELVDVTGPDGAFWIVRYRRDDHEVAVTSFSGCFRLPDEIWPGDHY